jgi:hypothetical protein
MSDKRGLFLYEIPLLFNTGGSAGQKVVLSAV